MDSFLDRLEMLAAGRSLHSWLTVSLEWSKGTVDRVRQGAIPGPDFLAQLVVTEGVNLSWLLCGIGSPYLVQHLSLPVEVAEFLDDRPESDGWLRWNAEVRGTGALLFVALRPPHELHVAVSLSGGLGYVMQRREVGALQLGDREIDAIARGKIGGYRLLQLLPNGTVPAGVAEPATRTTVANRASGDTTRTLLEIAALKLGDEDLKLLVTIANRLVDGGAKRK